MVFRWIMGHGCRQLVKVPNEDPAANAAYSFHSWDFVAPGNKMPVDLGERFLIYDHAYINGTNLPVPDRPTTDIAVYADSAAAGTCSSATSSVTYRH